MMRTRHFSFFAAVVMAAGLALANTAWGRTLVSAMGSDPIGGNFVRFA